MKKDIYFVRHGESTANAQGEFLGSEANLTEKGREEARTVAERIARIGVEAIVTSPFPRTRETAEAIAAHTGHTLEENALFIETRPPSAFSGLPHEHPDVVETARMIFAGYSTPGFRHSDEENIDDLAARARAALAFLEAHPAERICVVTHGRFLRVLFVAMWLGGEFSGEAYQRALRTLHTSTTGVTYATYHSERPHVPQMGMAPHPWRIIAWNDSAHLG